MFTVNLPIIDNPDNSPGAMLARQETRHQAKARHRMARTEQTHTRAKAA